MTTEQPLDKAGLEKQLSRLTTERTTLFARAGATAGLSKDEQSRLTLIERQIDECFIQIRQHRAAREARRFTNESRIIRRGLSPRQEPGAS